jgi:TatD DNase family protein
VTLELIDCHAHLDELSDLSGALERSAAAGVKHIVAVAENAASSRRILEIARSYETPKILPAAGLYPAEVSEEEIEQIAELISSRRNPPAALGEIGLDYWIKPLRKKEPGREEKKALQQKAFLLQLEIARKYSLVPIIHSRGAWKDCFRMVDEMGLKRAVFHWYSGPPEVLELILGKGYHISATPAAAYSLPHRQALKMAPLEKIILETDCPVPRREGDRTVVTEPADVIYSLKALAGLKGVSEEKIALGTTANAAGLFGLNLTG